MNNWAALRERIRKFQVERPDGCIVWSGAIDPQGYARMSYKGQNCRVSRLAWQAHHEKPWPAGKFALHQCDNRPCVNPLHIRPGTHAENISEMWARNASLRRTHCPHGHEYTPDNIVRSGNRRSLQCRECKRKYSTLWNRRRSERKRMEKSA